MTGRFSLPDLLSNLSEPSRYKNVKAYIQEAAGDSNVERILSNAIKMVLQSHAQSVISKMHVLKLFKDIFQNGNMDIVDNLDQKIQQHLISLALYKKQRKVAQRGHDYFHSVENRPDTTQNRQIGISYIIMCLQIICNFSQWYPVDTDGEQSRFKQYYEILIEKGVTFPTNMSYFKPADRSKFEINYKNWKNQEKNTISTRYKETKIDESVDQDKRIFKSSNLKESSDKKNEELSKKNSQLNKKNEELTVKLNKITKQQQQLEIEKIQMEKEHEKQTKQLKATIDKQQSQIKFLKKENQRLNKERVSKQDQDQQEKQQRSSLINKINELNKEMSKMKHDYDQIQQKYIEKYQDPQQLNTKVFILQEDLKRALQQNVQMQEQLQKLRRQVSVFKSKDSLANSNSDRPQVLENKVLKEKCRLLELRLRDGRQSDSAHKASSNQTRFEVITRTTSNNLSGHNYFKAKVRPSSRRLKCNQTTEDRMFLRTKLTESMNIQKQRHEEPQIHQTPPSVISFDPCLFQPINLRMHLFRNACLGRKRAFYDCSQLQIRLVQKSHQFFINIHNKTKREMRLELYFQNSKEFIMSDDSLRSKMILGANKWAQNSFSIYPNRLSCHYPSGRLIINGVENVIYFPITLLSFCEFIKDSDRHGLSRSTILNGWTRSNASPVSVQDRQFKQPEIIMSHRFHTDNHVTPVSDYFYPYKTVENSNSFQAQCLVRHKMDCQTACLLLVDEQTADRACQFSLTYEKHNKKAKMFSECLIQLLMFCFTLSV